jgi:hypothetical protein
MLWQYTSLSLTLSYSIKIGKEAIDGITIIVMEIAGVSEGHQHTVTAYLFILVVV